MDGIYDTVSLLFRPPDRGLLWWLSGTDIVSVLNTSVSRRSQDVFMERLGLEDITSRSRVSGFVTLGLVNIHACIRPADISGRGIRSETQLNCAAISRGVLVRRGSKTPLFE